MTGPDFGAGVEGATWATAALTAESEMVNPSPRAKATPGTLRRGRSTRPVIAASSSSPAIVIDETGISRRRSPS